MSPTRISSTPYEFIRDQLTSKLEEYVTGMLKEYNKSNKAQGYKVCTLESFCRYISTLKRLGLIELSHTEPIMAANMAGLHDIYGFNKIRPGDY